MATAEERVTFPYVPDLLSFREAAIVPKAAEGLWARPDLLLVDGKGTAHPRRFGLACHLGLLLDVPTIGCMKSRLIDQHDSPGPERGARFELVDHGKVIGAALRTRDGVWPPSSPSDMRWTCWGPSIGLWRAGGGIGCRSQRAWLTWRRRTGCRSGVQETPVFGYYRNSISGDESGQTLHLTGGLMNELMERITAARKRIADMLVRL